MATAEQIYWRGEFDSARVVWRSALQHRAPADSVTEPRVLTWLGLAAYRQGDYEQARGLGEQALSLKLARKLDGELPRSYNALGLIAWNEGRLSDAEVLFGQALAKARTLGDPEFVAKASNSLGLVQAEFGAFDQAEANFRLALRTGHTFDDARIQGGALTNLGMLDVWSGNPASALESLTRARLLYQSVDYETGEENVLGQMATAYAALGEPQRAFALLDTALAIARKQGMRGQEASNLEIIADLYRELGDGERALESYAQAREINRELGLSVELGNDLRSEAAIRGEAGLLQRAGTDAEQALQLHRTAGARFEELHDLLLMAQITGSRSAALHMTRARRLARTLGMPIARVRVAIADAELAETARDWHRVLETLDAAGPDLHAGSAANEWKADALRARAHASLGALDSAVVAGRRAVAALTRVRGNLGGGALHTRWLAGKARVYSDLVAVLLRTHREDEAFEVSEASRGQPLLDHLPSLRGQAGSSGRRGVGEARELLRRIEALTDRLGDAENTPPDERGPDAAVMADELTRRLQGARSDYEALLARMAIEQPGRTALLGAHGATVSEVRSALRPGEVLLEYMVTPGRVLAFAVTRTELKVVESAVTEADLTARVRLARSLFGQRDARAAESDEVAQALHRILIRPVVSSGAFRHASRVLVVGHGVLNYLPFAALRDAATGRTVADDYVILSLPTAATLTALRSGVWATSPAATRSKGTAYAPFPDRLAASRGEAESFRTAVRRGRARFGSDASEAQLRASLIAGDLVHVASHGVLNPINPMFSRLELAPGDGTPENDGRLEVHELMELSISSPLAFLSGCETGLGVAWTTDFARGEDYTTVAQSFLYAGARNVVATLWRIEDAGAAVFAGRFYQHLKNRSPADALAEAQRDTRNDPRYASPYYWAAYVLSGEG
jgi:CHAT domain-containing protein/tetratricopeptide (TPR) repeat protein